MARYGRYTRKPQSKEQAMWMVKRGGILLAVGVAITVGTFALASQLGGIAIVSIGPLAFGALYLVNGLRGMNLPPAGAPQAPPMPAYPTRRQAPTTWQPPRR